MAALGLIRIFSEDKELETGDKKGLAGKYRKPSECFFKATPGIEPGYTALQAAA